MSHRTNLTAPCIQILSPFPLVKRASSIQYGYRKCGTRARVSSQTLTRSNNKNEIIYKNRRWEEKSEYWKHIGQEKRYADGLTVARACYPGSLLSEAVDKPPNEPNKHLWSVHCLLGWPSQTSSLHTWTYEPDRAANVKSLKFVYWNELTVWVITQSQVGYSSYNNTWRPMKPAGYDEAD